MYRAGTATIVSWLRVKNVLRICPTHLPNCPRPPNCYRRYTRFIRTLNALALTIPICGIGFKLPTRTVMQLQCCGDDGLFKTAAGQCNLSPHEGGYCHVGCKIICVAATDCENAFGGNSLSPNSFLYVVNMCSQDCTHARNCHFNVWDNPPQK